MMSNERITQQGAVISALRQRLSMTQEEFAHAIGVTVSTVNRWENGHIEPSRLARKAMQGLAAQAAIPMDLEAASAPLIDTAALIAELDLVISVDTSIAHLAGALGRRCWLLLPFAPDWRWMLDRDDTPWYPAMRLFRQSRLHDWSSVVARVAAELRAWPP
jgi:transcriptional regulator with XRE-family HTH domain